MASPEKQHIVRRLLRFFEISLFFLISVLGYGFLAKTSSFNTKSKSNDCSSKFTTSGCVYENTSSLPYLYSLSKSESPVGPLLPSTPFYAFLCEKSPVSPQYRISPPFLKLVRFHSSYEHLFLLNQVFII